MFSYIGENLNAVEGQSYKVFVRGDHGRQVYKWSTQDDYQTGDLNLSPLPVLVHPRVTQGTRSQILNSKWNIGTLVLHKKQLTDGPAGGAGVLRRVHLEVQAQPAYQFAGFNSEGTPTLFQTTRIVSGAANRYKVPITLIREDSDVPFTSNLPSVSLNNHAVETPITPSAREGMGAVIFPPVRDEIDLTAEPTGNGQPDSVPGSRQDSAPSTSTDARVIPGYSEAGTSSSAKRRNSGEVMGTPDSKQQRGEKSKPTKENIKKNGGEAKKNSGGGNKTSKSKKTKSPSKNQTTLATSSGGMMCLQPPAPVPDPPAVMMTRARMQRSTSPEAAALDPTTPATPTPSASASGPPNTPITPKTEQPDIKHEDGHEELPGVMQNINISTPRGLKNSAEHEYEPLLTRFLNATSLEDVMQEPASPDRMERLQNLHRATQAHARVLRQRELGLKMAAINGRALSSVLPRGIIKKEPAEDMSISSSSASDRNMDTSDQSSTGPRRVTFEDQFRDGNVSFELPGVTYLPNPADHKEIIKQESSATIEEIQDNLEDSIKTTKRRGRVPVTGTTSEDSNGQHGTGTSGTQDNIKAGEDYQSGAATSGTGTGRPLLFDDLTISDTDSEADANKPVIKTEEGDPEGEGDNGGAQH